MPGVISLGMNLAFSSKQVKGRKLQVTDRLNLPAIAAIRIYVEIRGFEALSVSLHERQCIAILGCKLLQRCHCLCKGRLGELKFLVPYRAFLFREYQKWTQLENMEGCSTRAIRYNALGASAPPPPQGHPRIVHPVRSSPVQGCC